MTLRVSLIGPPGLVRGGDERPMLRGRKTWALLALFALESGAQSRRDLAARLWPEADDPLAALRWTLLQVRRALAPDAEIVERDHRLQLVPAGSLTIDAVRVLAGAWEPDDEDDPASGELLEGYAFDDAPAFEAWLSLQRARVASACVDGLRSAATLVARSDPVRAELLVQRALMMDPFDDGLHELVVDLRVSSGDEQGARAYVEALGRRYRRELGVEVPETVLRPLARPAPAPGGPLIRLDVAARALLGAASVRMEAGDYEGSLAAARRAASDAAGSGDRALEARALVAVANVLLHSLRGRDRESLGLLARALRLASELGDSAVISDAEREFGYVAFLDARYGAAEAALSRAITAAREIPDPVREARALTYLGMCRSDRCEFEQAAGDLAAARTLLEAANEPGHAAYTMACQARTHLRTGRLTEARALGAEAEALAAEAGALSILPWPMVNAAEAALLDDDAAEAQETFGRAFTLGCEIGDPCWEGLSLRGLALVEAYAGRRERAVEMLEDALRRDTRFPDTYRWSEALILTDLAELEHGADPARVDAALGVATSGPMPDLVERLRALQTQTHGQTASP
jgi:DNA-binding SARP family transcriptional activator